MEIADGILLRRPDEVTADAREAIGTSRVIVTPDYFLAMGIAIEEGRAFTDADRGSTALIAIVSRTLARTLWGDASAVGRELELSTGRGWERYQVVGVAEEVRSRVIDRPALEVYVPHGRGGLSLDSYVVTHAGSVTVGMINAALRKADPEVVLERLQTTRAVVDAVIAPSRLLATAMSMLGTTGLVLLALGIFGAAATTLRIARAEMAIRQAVGATPLTAARAPLRSILLALVCGSIAGIALAPGALGVLAAMGVAESAGMITALAIAGAAVALSAAVAIGLSLGPAMKVSPAELLRAE